MDFCDSKYDRRKIFYHPRAIADLLETGDTWPLSISTGFTTYCNHSCAWCTTAHTTRVPVNLKSRDELMIDPDVWIKNVRILARNGTKAAMIAGQGEPILHPKADEMLHVLAEEGIGFVLFTNGERLSEKFHDTLFRGALGIRFSVDAATREMHTRWHAAQNAYGRGRANFDAVVRNIERLVQEKRRRGAENPSIGCQMICSSLTMPDFEAFAELFKKIGVDYVVYKSLQHHNANKYLTETSLSLHPTEDERQRIASEMCDILEDVKRRYESPEFEVIVKVRQLQTAYVREYNGAVDYDRCRAHPLVPLIEPDGNVYICIDHEGDPEFVMGNIYEKDIDEIWRSERRREVIARIDLKNSCPAGCFLDETNVILHKIANPRPEHHHVLI